MHKLFRDALCFHVSVDGYLWSGFNSAELSTIETNMEASKGAIRDSSAMDISLTSTALEATNNNQINIELN